MKQKFRSTLRYLSLHKTGVRMLSMLLALLIIFYVIPSTVFAEIGNALSESEGNSDVSAQAELASYSHEKILYEVEELREENVKHFHLEDGSYIAAQYSYPVHTMNETGGFEDIDNMLSEESSGEFSNSSARIKFAKKITGNETLFALKDKNTKLTMSLIGAKKGTTGSVVNYSDSDGETELQKMLHLEKLRAKVLYADILDGVDVEYIAESLNVKENIIVKTRADSYKYSFELKLNGLEASLDGNGNVVIKNSESGEAQYTVPAPVVYDSAYQTPEAGMAYYTLDGKGNKYILTVTVDSEWMNSEERVFPVTVDPTVSAIAPNTEALPLESDGIDYLYWKTDSLPAISGVSKVILTVPHDSARWDSSLPLLAKPVLSADGEDIEISDYVISRAELDGNSNYELDITDIWNKWRAGERANNGLAIYQESTTSVRSASVAAYSLNSAATYSTTPSVTVGYTTLGGIEAYYATTSHSAGNAGNGTVNLADGKLTFAIPTLTTTDSIMPYTPTLVYNSDVTDYTAQYANTVYNTSYMPYGFKLNICETVVAKTANGSTYYVYMDADGTEHAFYQSENASESNVYYDEDGLQMTMTVDTYTITVKDSEKITRTFSDTNTYYANLSDGWYLTEISDKIGNKVSFTYENGMPILVKIEPYGFGVIPMLYMYYNSDGLLYAVHNSAAKEAVIFRYSETPQGSVVSTGGKYLREAVWVFGSSSMSESDLTGVYNNTSYTTNINAKYSMLYSYDTSGKLVSVYDGVSSQTIGYTIDSLGRVTGVAHYGSSSALGQSISVTYGTGFADVRSTGNDDALNTADDIITRYVVDEKGRAISVYSFSETDDEIYGATFGEYETQDNIKNNIKEQTVLGGSSVNYLYNGNFELVDYTGDYSWSFWEISGAISQRMHGIESATDASYTAYFYPTVGGTASIHQYIYLPAGEYTLSMPVHSQLADGVTGYAKVTSIAGSGLAYTDEIHLNAKSNNGITSFFSTTFTVPNHIDGGDKIKLAIEFTAASTVTTAPTIYVDNVMLSKGVGATDYSPILSGSMESAPLDSSGNVTLTLNSCWQNYYIRDKQSIVESEHPFGNVFKIEANGYNNYGGHRIYRASDEIRASFDAGNSPNNHGEYIISGYAKAYNAAAGGKIRLSVEIKYYQGQNAEPVTRMIYFDFLNNCDGWQFLAGKFSTEYDLIGNYTCVDEIYVYCDYSLQSDGYALFDNISVIKAEGVSNEKYYYNSDGQLVRRASLFYEEFYEYDANDNITRIANNRGELTDYTYNSVNLLTATVDYDFTFLGGTYYPYYYVDPDASIIKTPKSQTIYNYNEYMLLKSQVTSKLNADMTVSSTGGNISRYYEYYTDNSNVKIFGALKREHDGLYEDFRYFYGAFTGRLIASVNANDGSGTYYKYDAIGNLINVTPASYSSSAGASSISDAESVTYTYNSHNFLTKIQTESTTYTFTYDAFGNQSSVKAGSNTLATYEYNQNNGKLNKINYGNGFSVEYVYNSLELLSEVWYNYSNGNRSKVYSYEYNADGQLYEFTDWTIDSTVFYDYDINGRLVSFSETDSSERYHRFSSELIYNSTTGMLSSATYKINYPSGAIDRAASFQYLYSYNSDGSLMRERLLATGADVTKNYTYDTFDRLSSTSATLGSITMAEEYTYRRVSSGVYNFTDYRISQYKTYVNSAESKRYSYVYNSNGYITSVTDINGTAVSYKYDDLGQLVRENNQYMHETYIYVYDNAGNLICVYTYDYTTGDLPATPRRVKEYGYSDGSWGDLLYSVNGNGIAYDSIGNPVSYYTGATFTWTGRQLVRSVNDGVTCVFSYNDEGIRTSKTVNGVTTTYYLEGSRIIGEETNGNLTVYIYDASGSPIGMQYHASSNDRYNWEVYWYEKNLQGDIVAVYNNSGIPLVSYDYDAWGNQTVIYSNDGENTVAANNPFRYRGYYYDADLDLYYLNSRYYDSYTGRFLNADNSNITTATPMGLTDKNLYSYCDNNPVMRVDNGGEFWNVIVGAVVGAAISLVTSVVSEIIEGDFEWKDVGQVAISTAIGAIEGAAIALVPSAAIAISAVASAADTAINSAIDGKDLKTIAVDSLISGAIGAAGGAYGSDFAKGGKLINEAVGSISHIVKKGVHPTVKKTAGKVVKKAIKYVGKSAATGLAEEFAYGGIYQFSSWYTNAMIDRAFGR